jgi:hypothetical protein
VVVELWAIRILRWWWTRYHREGEKKRTMIEFSANLYYAIVFENTLTCHRGSPFLQNAIGREKSKKIKNKKINETKMPPKLTLPPN